MLYSSNIIFFFYNLKNDCFNAYVIAKSRTDLLNEYMIRSS